MYRIDYAVHPTGPWTALTGSMDNLQDMVLIDDDHRKAYITDANLHTTSYKDVYASERTAGFIDFYRFTFVSVPTAYRRGKHPNTAVHHPQPKYPHIDDSREDV
jgi:hypothetical protein